MEYEIVNLEEMQVVGMIARTNNQAPDMEAVIGGLWGRFYQGGIVQAIPNKKDERALGLYMEYDGDHRDDYTIMVGVRSDAENHLPDGTVIKKIPAGRYAKFVVKGALQKAVADFWSQLWSMDLPRAFQCDFEEYQNEDMENAEIHIYIGLKE